jgi:hypothetical protein
MRIYRPLRFFTLFAALAMSLLALGSIRSASATSSAVSGAAAHYYGAWGLATATAVNVLTVHYEKLILFYGAAVNPADNITTNSVSYAPATRDILLGTREAQLATWRDEHSAYRYDFRHLARDRIRGAA